MPIIASVTTLRWFIVDRRGNLVAKFPLMFGDRDTGHLKIENGLIVALYTRGRCLGDVTDRLDWMLRHESVIVAALGGGDVSLDDVHRELHEHLLGGDS